MRGGQPGTTTARAFLINGWPGSRRTAGRSCRWTWRTRGPLSNARREEEGEGLGEWKGEGAAQDSVVVVIVVGQPSFPARTSQRTSTMARSWRWP
eukprot:3963143-Pyramimonas_sp.AAC.1